MNIGKAIELLEELKRGLDLPLMSDQADAIELGIEALKRAKYQRISQGMVFAEVHLPGETE